MLCEECKTNPATVSVFVTVNGERTVRRLCSACMKQKGISLVQGNLGNFLGSVLSVLNAGRETEETPQKTCPQCGLTYAEFKKTGRLGCAGCYTAFAEELKPLLQKIHGCAQHSGKKPEHTQYILTDTIEHLQKKMADAVAAEDFEEAAVYRDKIRALTRSGEEAAK